MIRWTAVLHSVLSDGSFCCGTMPVLLTICHTTRTATGLISRSQPLRRPVRPRAPRAGGAAVTPAIGRLPGPATVPASAGLPRLVALVLADTDTAEPLPCSGLNQGGAPIVSDSSY